MAEREVIVLCYWNGCVKYGPDGVYYQGSTPKKISVKQKTEFSRLVDGLHIITGFDKQRWKLDIIGRYPVVFPPHLLRYVHLPVVNDSSLKTMLEVPSIHPSINTVELYLEVKPTSDDVIDLAVKLERDNGIEVNADLGNGCTHGAGGGELMDKNSGLGEVAQAVNLTGDNVNADKGLNVPGLEASANASASKPWSLCNLWVDDHESSGVSTLFPMAIPPPPPPTHVSRKRKESYTSLKASFERNKQTKSASMKKPVIEKDRTKEPPPSGKEEVMAEEEEETNGDEEKDDGEEINTPMDYPRYHHSRGVGSSSRGGRSARETHIPDSTPDIETPHMSQPTGTAFSAPTSMTIEQFVSQPGRDRLTRLDPDTPPNTTWFQYSGNGITGSINAMMNSMVTKPYPTYHDMPVEDRDTWFRQFAQDFTWDPPLTSLVRKRFDKKATRKYSLKMNEWKDAWYKTGKVPRVMKHKDTCWAGLVAHWEQEATRVTSRRNSSNRNSSRKGKGPATHNLGAKSKASLADKMFQETGVFPSNLALFKATHTNKKTGEIQDPIAREIVETVERLGEQYLQSQPIEGGTPAPTEVPYEKINEFIYKATPKTRGRVFGLPEDSCLSVSSVRYGGGSRLEAENRGLTERLKAVDKAREKDKAEAEERFRALEEKMTDFFRTRRPE